MDWMIPSITAALAATGVLVVAYAYLYHYERKPALGLWTMAWIFFCLRYLVELGWYDRRFGAVYILGVQEFGLLTGLFLIWGCFAWRQKRLPAGWWIAAAVCGIWAVVGVARGWSLRMISMPIFLYIGITFLVTGLSFWKRNDLGLVSRRILTIAFLLWAAHKFDYPFFRTIDELAPWGYVPSVILSLVVAIGLLAAYLEREHRRLLDTRSRMQGLLDSTQETLIMIDPTGVVLACNETVARRLGMSAEDLPGCNLFTVLSEPSSSFRRQKVEAILQTGRSVEFEDERNGRLYWNFMTPVFNPDGSIRAVSIFAEDITQRRKAEMERNRLFTYSVDLLCTAGFDGYLRELNPAWTQTLGWSETELKSRPRIEFVHPDDQPATIEATKRLEKGQTLLGFENRYRCKNGSWRWLSWNTFPLVDQGQVFAVGRDVTEAKQARDKLRAKEQEFRAIIETSKDMIWAMDLRGNLTFCNNAVGQILGYEVGELLNKPVMSLMEEEERQEIQRRLQEYTASRSGWNNWVIRWRHKDGSLRYLESNAVPVLTMEGELAGFRGVDRDITERKQADAKLHESEEKFSKMFRLNPEAMSISRLSDGIYLEVNDAFVQLSGYSRQEVIGHASTEIGIWVDPQDRSDMIQLLREQGRIHQFETKFYRKDRSIITAIFSAAPIEMRGEQYLLSIVMDITEQRKLKAERDRLFNYSIDPMCVAGFDGYFKQLNPAWTRALGWSPEELMAQPWIEFVHPDDLPATHRAGQDLAEGKSVLGFENRYRCKDGSYRWLSWNSFPLSQELLIFAVVRDVTDQKTAEQAVRERQATLDSIYRAAPTGIGMVTNRVFTQVNDPICEMTGYSREELIGQSARMLYPSQEEFDKVGREKYDQVRRFGFGSVETRWKKKDGGLLDILLSSSPLNVSNLAEGVVFTAMDITERKRTERELIHFHDLMRYIIEHNRSAIAVHDRDLRYIYVSQRYLDDYKVKEKDIIGKHHYEVFPDLPRKWRDVHQRALAGEVCSAEDDPYVRADGTTDWTRWECRPWYEADGSIGGIIIYTEVITARKKAEQELRESQRRLSTLMSNLPGIAYRCLNNRDWTMEFISAGCMALTGYPASDLIGNAKLAYNDLIHPDDREMVWETVQKALPTQSPYQITYRICTASGDIKWVWEQGRGVFDETGKLQALEGLITDMNDRVLAEQQREDLLKALQTKTEELESIIYVSSHDLRSPLVNIQGFSNELEESCRQVRKLLSGNTVVESRRERIEELLDREIPSALEYITSSAAKLDALQKGLLKICRIGRESLNPGTVSMNELIDGVLKSIQYQIAQCGARVEIDSLPACRADASQLTQVFTNLVDNAIKYRSPDRSLVIRIYGRVEKNRCIYAVADNGVGIAKEHQQKVFEMFHQLDPSNGPGGEGLGLTIVKRILGRMDGEVRLESAPGVGSVFFISLPKE